MNIFRLQSVIPTKSGRPKRAPLLECNPSAKKLLAEDRFRGQPFPDEWRTFEMNFGNHAPWKADFYFYGPGALVCSERARDALAPLEDEGEFLPVHLRGIRGSYFLYNSTNCRSYLNATRTAWKPNDSSNQERMISRHGFWAERIGDDCIFKLLEEGAISLYCIERTGDPHDGEFKALVLAHKLTGLSFRLLWKSNSLQVTD